MSVKDVTSLARFSDPGSAGAMGLFPLFMGAGLAAAGPSPAAHEAKLQGCTAFPSFPALVMNLMPEAQFSSFLDFYQNKPQKACRFLYNLRRIIAAAANYSGTDTVPQNYTSIFTGET